MAKKLYPMLTIKTYSILILLSFITNICLGQDTPDVAAQQFLLYKDFPSDFIPSRDLEVWLPENYENLEALPVLYLLDGQNMFHGTEGWGGEYNRGWEVDECLDSLSKAGLIQDVIVVGLHNGKQLRMSEYMPQKPAQVVEKRIKENMHEWYASFKDNPPNSDMVLRYIVEEVKPFIDEHFKTLTNRDNTYIGGSSMGGIMSLYAICEYPEIFGRAACFSSHWPPLEGVFLEYVKDHLPDPKTHKIYFDYGTEGLDGEYEPFQKQVDVMMQKAGYEESTNWMTKKFQGEDHHEKYWRKRFHIPMEWLLKR